MKKRLQQRCFPLNFSKFSRASFLQTSPVHCFWIFSPPLLDYFWILLKIYYQILARKKTAMSLFLDQTVNALFQKKQNTFRLGSGKWAHDLNWASMRNSYDVVDVLWTIFEVQVVKLGCQVFRLSDQSKISWKNLIHLCFSYLL